MVERSLLFLVIWLGKLLILDLVLRVVSNSFVPFSSACSDTFDSGTVTFLLKGEQRSSAFSKPTDRSPTA